MVKEMGFDGVQLGLQRRFLAKGQPNLGFSARHVSSSTRSNVNLLCIPYTSGYGCLMFAFLCQKSPGFPGHDV